MLYIFESNHYLPEEIESEAINIFLDKSFIMIAKEGQTDQNDTINLFQMQVLSGTYTHTISPLPSKVNFVWETLSIECDKKMYKLFFYCKQVFYLSPLFSSCEHTSVLK